MNTSYACLISGYSHKVAENSALLDYCTATSGNFLPTFWKCREEITASRCVITQNSAILTSHDYIYIQISSC
jgi:hypothetical protein